MKIKNAIISNNIDNLLSIAGDTEIYIPAKTNFFIQKNISLLIEANKIIEENRIKILQHYGVFDAAQNAYNIPKEKIDIATQELEDLFNIEQDLTLTPIKIAELEEIKFTPAQMQAMMFMIED